MISRMASLTSEQVYPRLPWLVLVLFAVSLVLVAVIAGCAPRHEGLTPDEARAEIHRDAERVWCEEIGLKPEYERELCL